ncbi:MAG: hypothetical protein WCV92_01045 [Candidatus Buchananbacteria bacterium]
MSELHKFWIRQSKEDGGRLLSPEPVLANNYLEAIGTFVSGLRLSREEGIKRRGEISATQMCPEQWEVDQLIRDEFGDAILCSNPGCRAVLQGGETRCPNCEWPLG